MRIFSYSIRSHVLNIIIMMGVAALFLLVTTAWVFRNLAWESQQLAFIQLADLEVADLLNQLRGNSVDLAMRLQHAESFREAYVKGDVASLQAQLNDQFHQYYYTSGIIKIRRLQVLDLDFNLLTESTEGDIGLMAGTPVCPRLIEEAAPRTGARRLKPLSSLCMMDGHAYYAVLAPVGGLKLSGYLLVSSDPLPVLAQLDRELGASIHISDAAGELLYRSAEQERLDNAVYLPVTYPLQSRDGETAYAVAIQLDITDFDRQTKRVFGIVLSLSVGVTLVVMLLALFVFRRSTILPLERLSHHLKRLHDDNTLLGQPLHVDGNTEIRELAESFNEMSASLATMQERLSTLAYSDTLTGAASRLAFNTELAKLTGNARRAVEPGFALFIIDLNKFKEINDRHGHDTGDRLLQAVVQRMKAALRDSDFIARLGGDEFGVILPGVVTAEVAERVGLKILARVRQPLQVRDVGLTPCLSIGASLYPQTTISREALLRAADHAMYNAKQRGTGIHIAPPCPDICAKCAGEPLH